VVVLALSVSVFVCGDSDRCSSLTAVRASPGAGAGWFAGTTAAALRFLTRYRAPGYSRNAAVGETPKRATGLHPGDIGHAASVKMSCTCRHAWTNWLRMVAVDRL
jgi:hypothetical protein